MTTTGYKRTLLTGGTANALDSIDASTLVEDDFAFVFIGGKVLLYNYKNYGSAQTEASPDIIVPDNISEVAGIAYWKRVDESQILRTDETPIEVYSSDNFAWQLQEQPSDLIIAVNTTFYLAITGNDSTGDGSSGTPWYSLEKAFEYLAGIWINDDVTVTISIGDGTYTSLNAFTINHPCSSQIEISGFAMATTILTFSLGGITVSGTTLALLEELTLKRATVAYIGMAIDGGNVSDISNVYFDTWNMAIQLTKNSYVNCIDSETYNCKYGLNLNHSSADIDTCDFDGNSISSSYGFYINENSHVTINSATTIVGFTYGCYADTNSFIDATGVTSNTATTPYSPLATTSSSAEPTWNNWGSWIKD